MLTSFTRTHSRERTDQDRYLLTGEGSFDERGYKRSLLAVTKLLQQPFVEAQEAERVASIISFLILYHFLTVPHCKVEMEKSTMAPMLQDLCSNLLDLKDDALLHAPIAPKHFQMQGVTY